MAQCRKLPAATIVIVFPGYIAHLEVELKNPDNLPLDTIVKEISQHTKIAPNSIKVYNNGEDATYKLTFNIVHTINENEIIETLKNNKNIINVSWSAL